jgi:hypothetical protein
VKGIAIEELGLTLTLALMGDSVGVAGVVALAVVVGTVCELGTSDVETGVAVSVDSDVGMVDSVPEATGVLSPVGVVVIPVPVEVPAVGVMPDTESDEGETTPVETSVLGVATEVSVSDVGMAILVSGVGRGDPVVTPVEMGELTSGVGRGVPVVIPVGVKKLVSGVGNTDPVGISVKAEDRTSDVGIVGVGRIGVTSVGGAVPDGKEMVGRMEVTSVGATVPVGNERVGMSVSVGVSEGRPGREVGSTSDVGIKTSVVVPEGGVTMGTVGVGAVGPVDGSVMPVGSKVTVGTSEVTSEITEETSETTEDTKEGTPGRSTVVSDVVSDVGIAVGLVAELSSDPVGVGAVSVPKAVVMPTTIPEESVMIGD